MRRIPSTVRPAAARRGLGAVVLLALLALLHASFSPGPSHLSGLDLDGCRMRSLAASAHYCETVAPVLVTAAGSDHHHQDGDAAQSCDAFASGPRQFADFSLLQAAPATTSDVPMAPAPAGVPRAMTAAAAADSPFGPAVLRC
ncbi:hypothetical protein [Streptomyces sp. CdTB01]|uniref:hypothetical protein n=1 Tax=Streptomyces sp. CdTB01 TaxID=1725411 RepID=UPI00073A72F9|nr:hypothetical protein [Streptomyces sp. CdTB01]ALV33527.1 hypothetical protein AS200_16890 [Streptomyces sp. CdTB01]